MCNDVLSAVTFHHCNSLLRPLEFSRAQCCAGCFINKVCGGHGPVQDNDDDYLEKEIEFSGAAVKIIFLNMKIYISLHRNKNEERKKK